MASTRQQPRAEVPRHRAFYFAAVFRVTPEALEAAIADAPENLVQPGRANYDWSVLHHNLQMEGLASHPMLPADLQGIAAADSRLASPWAPLNLASGTFRAVTYILRTPQAGGHWIALLPSSLLDPEMTVGGASILCDSLKPHPFLLSLDETEHLLVACALEACARQRQDGHGRDIRWGCFLVTDTGTAE